MVKAKYTEIHIWSRENGQYVGNIIFDELRGVPQMSEEEFVDLILKHFPRFKGKGWITKFL